MTAGGPARGEEHARPDHGASGAPASPPRGRGPRAAGAAALLLAGMAVFLVLAQQVSGRDAMVRLDVDTASRLRDHAHEPWTTFFRVVTQLGSAAVLCAVCAGAVAVALRRGRRADAVLIVAALAGSQLLTLALKAAFDRPRPVLPDPLVTASWWSFPSGHASGSTAVYGTIALLAACGVGSAGARAALAAGCAALVGLIAFSRIYLGVHYLSDVLAGVGVGCACLGAIMLAHLALSGRPGSEASPGPPPTRRAA